VSGPVEATAGPLRRVLGGAHDLVKWRLGARALGWERWRYMCGQLCEPLPVLEANDPLSPS